MTLLSLTFSIRGLWHLGDEVIGSAGDASAIASMIEAARKAGDIALRYFHLGARTKARIDYKPGGSPVTEADLAVDAFLRTNLGRTFAGVGWLSEETEDDRTRLSCRRILVVDPIDGTRAFLAGDPRWAVSIALVEEGRPVAGVVHAPALAETYAATRGGGAALNGVPIRVSARQALAGARVAGPRPMVDSIERAVGNAFVLEPKIPSLAYRVALVASGALDIALASEQSHDWDVAAADVILEEAGGRLTEASGRPLNYNQSETSHGVLFGASTTMIGPLLAAAHRIRGDALA
jgi:myo-inositol-1(or 4)-monophosphatase